MMYPSSAEAALMLYLLTVTGGAPAPGQIAQPPTPDRAIMRVQMSAATAQAYVEKAAGGDRFEIESSELAMQRAKSAEVREFAERMIKDHKAATQTLMSAVKSANLQITMPPPVPDKSQQSTLEQLRDAREGQFDELYMQAQIVAHKEALQLHRTYAQTGDSPPLKTAANNMATIVEHHLSDAEQIHRGLNRGGDQLMETPTNPLGPGSGPSGGTLGPSR